MNVLPRMYRNKDVSSTSTARKALFQGPNHQVQIEQVLTVEKTTIRTLPANKQLEEDPSIHTAGGGGLAKKSRN